MMLKFKRAVKYCMAIKNSIMDIMSTAVSNSQIVEGHLDKVKDQFFEWSL